MTGDPNLRSFDDYLGIDWGALGVRIAATRPLEATDQTLSPGAMRSFSRPEVFLYKDSPWLTLAGVQEPGQTPLVGPRSLTPLKTGSRPADLVISPTYADWLEKDTFTATQAAAPAIDWLRTIVEMQLGAQVSDLCLTLPCPPANGASPGKSPAAAGAVVLREAGFPHVFSSMASEAAIRFHHFMGRVRFENHPELWAVVDIGARELRCTLVKCRQGDAPLQVDTRVFPFGGLLLDDVIGTHVWEMDLREHPGIEDSDYARFLVVQQLRDAKERVFGRQAVGSQEAAQLAMHPMLKLPGEQYVQVSLSIETFNNLCRPLLADWAETCAGALRLMAGPAGLRGCILSGGTACLAVTQEVFERALAGLLPPGALLWQDADRVVAFGLALAQANALPETSPQPAPEVVEIPTHSVKVEPLLENTIPPGKVKPPANRPDAPPVLNLKRKEYNAKARRMLPTFTLIGAGIALLLSPIPGASSPPLVFLEVVMLYRMAHAYLLKITSSAILWTVIALLGMSFLIKLVVVELITFVPVFGWMVKPLTAGMVIWILGELAIKFYEKQRYGNVGA